MPVICGSDPVTGWVREPARDHVWMKTDWPHNSQQVFVEGQEGQPLQQIGGKYLPFWYGWGARPWNAAA